MSFIAAASIAGGTSIIGGILGSKASKDAARMQADAANRATEMQWKMFEKSRADQEPWRQAGITALSQMADPSFMKTFSMADFQQDPGYGFRMQEGQKALERSAAARGGLNSGGFAKALTRFGQDYASNEYNNAFNRFETGQSNRFNRLSSLAGTGQAATNTVGNFGMNAANQAGQNMMGAANAGAAGAINSANAWGNTLSSIGKGAMDYASLSSNSSPSNNWMGQWNQGQASQAPEYFSSGYDSVSNFGNWKR